MQLFDNFGMPINREDDIIEHHGIKGQKWGVRRYQNPDGSLTPEGKKRYGDEERFNEEINKQKQRILDSGSRKKVYQNRSLFTSDELRKINERFRQEEELKRGNRKSIDIKKAGEIARDTAGVILAGVALIEAYKKGSKIINAMAKKKIVPEFDESFFEKMKKKEYYNMSAEEFVKNATSFDTSDIADRAKRETNINVILRAINDRKGN